MIEVLRVVLTVLVVVSLSTIIAYVVAFVVFAAGTVRSGSRRDPQAEELDRILAEIVGHEIPPSAGGQRGEPTRAPGPARRGHQGRFS